MFHVWTLVESSEGYDRTYRRGRHEVAFEPIAPGMKFLRRDLFIDGRPGSLPLPPVYVEGRAILSDDFYAMREALMVWMKAVVVGVTLFTGLRAANADFVIDFFSEPPTPSQVSSLGERFRNGDGGTHAGR